MDYTVHEILRAWILEWVAFPFSIGSSQPRDWTQVSCTVGGFFTSWATRAQLFSHSVMSNSLPPHGLQHARLPCPSLSPRVCPNSHSLSWWCHLILFHPFLLKPSIFPNMRVFSNESALHISWPKMAASASASVLLMSIEDLFPLGLTGLISLKSKGLSRVFSNTTFQKQQCFSS